MEVLKIPITKNLSIMRNIYTPRTPLSILTIFCFLFVAQLGFGQIKANDDFKTTNRYRGTDWGLNVGTNDVFPPNNARFKLIQTALNGNVSFDSTGKYQYFPSFDFVGIDSFYYAIYPKVNNGVDFADTAKVVIQVNNWTDFGNLVVRFDSLNINETKHLTCKKPSGAISIFNSGNPSLGSTSIIDSSQGVVQYKSYNQEGIDRFYTEPLPGNYQ